MTGRPHDLLSGDTSARLHARAVVVKRRLEGRFAHVRAAFPARPWCSAWMAGLTCEVNDRGAPWLRCEALCDTVPRDVIELARLAAGLSFDEACTRLEALADELDRAELTAAGQGELF